MPLLDECAAELIDAYNREPAGKTYNKVVDRVYEARRRFGNPFCLEFEAYIVEGLVGFDMRRTMEGGSDAFAQRLHTCLSSVKEDPTWYQLRDRRLSSADLDVAKPFIFDAYDSLALLGKLHSAKRSHVAATKTLHWLFPELLLIVDRYVGKAFRKHFGSWNSTPSSARYFNCLVEAQRAIELFGLERFRQLDPRTPEARIFDKIAFMIGKRQGEKRGRKSTLAKTELIGLAPKYGPVPTTIDDLLGSPKTFWVRISDLRKANAIPRRWTRKDIRPYLLLAGFKENTINSVPANQSVSTDRTIQGDYVKRGQPAKAFRIDRGVFELIDDPVER
jgi:hypothetical protein